MPCRRSRRPGTISRSTTALARQRKAVEILEELGADEAAALGDAKIFLVQYLRDTGDFESAEEILEELIAEGTARDGERSEIAARALALRASVQLVRGRFAEAERSYADVVERYDLIWGRPFHDTIVERREWGAALTAAGKPAERAALTELSGRLRGGGWLPVPLHLQRARDAQLALGRPGRRSSRARGVPARVRTDREHAFSDTLVVDSKRPVDGRRVRPGSAAEDTESLDGPDPSPVPRYRAGDQGWRTCGTVPPAQVSASCARA